MIIVSSVDFGVYDISDLTMTSSRSIDVDVTTEFQRPCSFKSESLTCTPGKAAAPRRLVNP